MRTSISRLSFLRKTARGLGGIAIILVPGKEMFYLISNKQKAAVKKSPRSKISCEFGTEGSAPRETLELTSFLKANSELGADFIVVQFSPDNQNSTRRGWKGSEKDFKDLATACREFNLTYFVNQECTNYSVEGSFVDKEGKDMLAHPDNTHRWDISGDLLDTAIKQPEFRGVLYDEPEHGQMRRLNNTNGGSDNKSSGRVHPYFAKVDGMSLVEAYNAVYMGAKAVAENYRSKGVIPMTEDVFPSMLFTFARAGFDPAIKFMKEGINSVYGAIAMGAAKQYGRELCITPDMWGLSGFPGHPPEELRASLLFAYWLGATKIFVENSRGLLDKKTENSIVKYEPSSYGKVYQWFVKEYVPAHPRSYTFRDIRPEVAILRFDDSCWGQKDSWLPDALYGAENLKTTPETAAWFQIWNLLTHGQTFDTGISYHNQSYKNSPHDFFCPLKGVVVYDHLAGAKELKGLKLIFLTGVLISPETLKEVRNFVKEGGMCISLSSLVPDDLESKSGEVPEGAGRWLIVKDFHADEVRKAIAPFLGKPDEISYLVEDKKLTIVRGNDGNSIKIYLQKAKDIDKNGETPESARVF